MAQIHYVVVFDTNTGMWDIDDVTTTVRFPDGNVWLEKEQKWTIIRCTPDEYDVESDALVILDGALGTQKRR